MSRLAFLHGDLEEEIDMEQPEGFIFNGEKTCLQIEKEFVWLETSSKVLVLKV